MPLSAIFIPEGLMALFLSNKRNAIEGEYSVKELTDMMVSFTDLLKNEELVHDFKASLSHEKTLDCISFFENQGSMTLNSNKTRVRYAEGSSTMLEFGK